MVRSNAIGHLCSSDSLHNIPGPLPFPLPDGVIGLLARCEPSCGPSLSSYCTYLLPSNDTLSLHFFIPTLCLADSASVVRNGDRGSRRTYESRGWRRACAASRHLLRALNMGFPQCVETRAGILNMPGHRVGGDQCPSPWSRSIPAPRHENHGPSWAPPRLRRTRPSFSIQEHLPDRHELIEVTYTPDEYSGCLESARP
jgi:hypothetical protein